MSELPAGWTTVQVKDVAAAMFDGPFGSALKTSDYTESGVRVARLENVGHLRFRNDLNSYVSEDKARALARHTLRGADILFSSFVDRETRVCLVPDELDGRMINKADCFCIRANPKLCDPRFLAYRLAAPSAYEAFTGAVRGVTRPRIGMRDLASFEIMVPPLAEQQRIVAKLDALTARTARARAELDRVPALAVRQKASLLERRLAFEGRSTTSLGELCEFVTSGSRGWAKHYSASGPLFIRVGNLRRGDVGLLTDDVQCVSPPERAEGLRTRCQAGDVLVTITADLGRAGIVPPDLGDAYVNQHVALVRLKDPRFGRFVAWYLTSPMGQAQLLEQNRGVTRSGLGLDDIRRVRIPVVTDFERHDTVTKIECDCRQIDRITSEATAARRLLDRLDQQVLAKAFRGELVPQDPADEPASALLERIRAERAGAPAKTRRGRRAA